jgi:hypothetical protein
VAKEELKKLGKPSRKNLISLTMPLMSSHAMVGKQGSTIKTWNVSTQG